MAIKFTDIKSEKTYNIIELLDKKGLVNEVFLSEEEIKHLNTIEDEVESDLYGFSLIIKRYFNELLSGDFSIMNKS